MAELLDIVSGKHTKNNKKLNSTQSLTDFCLIKFFFFFFLNYSMEKETLIQTHSR